jgi:hypothetical protein
MISGRAPPILYLLPSLLLPSLLVSSSSSTLQAHPMPTKDSLHIFSLAPVHRGDSVVCILLA